ncbi:hypothetical protein JW935_25785 [candidate division KSB1 bacterium]|nr:hypothetical protein [candidate division KSB1 bacterium]
MQNIIPIQILMEHLNIPGLTQRSILPTATEVRLKTISKAVSRKSLEKRQRPERYLV